MAYITDGIINILYSIIVAGILHKCKRFFDHRPSDDSRTKNDPSIAPARVIRSSRSVPESSFHGMPWYRIYQVSWRKKIVMCEHLLKL